MLTDPTTATGARIDIYELAITLRYLLVERACEGVSAGLWIGTVEGATRQLAELVARWPGAARLAVEFMEDCKPQGAFYAEVICTLRSMLARQKGNALLAEMAGES